MTKKDEQKTKSASGNGGGRVRGFVFGFDVEGNHDVLTKGLEALTQAMSKGGVVLGPAPAAKRALLPKGAGTSPATAVIDNDQIEANEEAFAPELAEPEAAIDDEHETSQNGNGDEKPKKVRKPKAPKVLDTPKLNEAKVPLQDFMDEKQPDDMMDKYAVVAVWLKEQFNVEEISMDHIFTAFKYLGKQSELPTDVAKPLNNLLHSRKWMDKGNNAGMFKLNWVGEDAVGKMPGKSK
jgi:hypothetical protein